MYRLILFTLSLNLGLIVNVLPSNSTVYECDETFINEATNTTMCLVREQGPSFIESPTWKFFQSTVFGPSIVAVTNVALKAGPFLFNCCYKSCRRKRQDRIAAMNLGPETESHIGQQYKSPNHLIDLLSHLRTGRRNILLGIEKILLNENWTKTELVFTQNPNVNKIIGFRYENETDLFFFEIKALINSHFDEVVDSFPQACGESVIEYDNEERLKNIRAEADAPVENKDQLEKVWKKFESDVDGDLNQEFMDKITVLQSLHSKNFDDVSGQLDYKNEIRIFKNNNEKRFRFQFRGDKVKNKKKFDLCFDLVYDEEVDNEDQTASIGEECEEDISSYIDSSVGSETDKED